MQAPKEIQELKCVKYFFKENILSHFIFSFSFSSFYLKVKTSFFLFKVLFKVFFPFVVVSFYMEFYHDLTFLYFSFSLSLSSYTLFCVITTVFYIHKSLFILLFKDYFMNHGVVN